PAAALWGGGSPRARRPVRTRTPSRGLCPRARKDPLLERLNCMNPEMNAFHGPLRDAFRACRRHFVGAAIFRALLNLLYLAPTLYMLQVYDRVVPSRSVTTLAFLTLVFTFAVATLAMLDWVRTRLLVRASARLDRNLSPQVIAAILSHAGAGGLRS